MKHNKLAWLIASISLSFTASHAHADSVELSKQTVTADFRQTDVQDLPEATTVIGNEQIQARSAEHLEQILSFAPNVNFSSGSSRARFYQIRGVGDRSQFIDPVNPSVGLYIDGIDMTGLGAAATLFDVEQVEILRGPQGTRFGANALGGMINIKSAAPTQETTGYISGKIGNYNSYGLGGALSGALADNVQGRIAVQGFQSDGYVKNRYLDRKDTQDMNEGLVRAKLAWQPSAATDVNFTYLHANINNGYDAFTLDNSRNSLADEPGKDKQKTHAFALNVEHRFGQTAALEMTLSGSHNKADYNFDEDWVYPNFDPNGYSSFDQYKRTYKRGALDVRLVSGADGSIFAETTDWVVGAYLMRRDQNLSRGQGEKANLDMYSNELENNSFAVYSELSTQLGINTRLIYGLRAENWRNDFSDSNSINKKTDEWLVGGKITLEQMLGVDHLSYASYALGRKPSGINSDTNLIEENRFFDKETNHAFELGLKSSWLENAWETRLALFYIERRDQQIKNSQPYTNSSNKIKFEDYLSNAAKGENYGVELESRWQLHERVLWELSYGYLHTEFKEHSFTNDEGLIDKSGRAQAYAPKHSGSTALTFGLTEALAFRVEAEAKDKFYFSDSHDAMASGYVLYHARLSFTQPRYELALSGRNLSNVDTETRGYYFGNDPRDNPPFSMKYKYVQLGEPRLVMLEGKLKF